MKNLDTEGKLFSHIQLVAEPSIISNSGLLAVPRWLYFFFLFNYSLHLLSVSWVFGLEAGPEGKIRSGTGSRPLHHIMQWSCAWAPSPMSRAPTGTTATALLSTVLCYQLQQMGWGWLGKKEEAEAHPAWRCNCKGSCSFIDERFFDEWLDLLCFSLYAWLAHSVN